jgi:hypothetical protein
MSIGGDMFGILPLPQTLEKNMVAEVRFVLSWKDRLLLKDVFREWLTKSSLYFSVVKCPLYKMANRVRPSLVITDKS